MTDKVHETYSAGDLCGLMDAVDMKDERHTKPGVPWTCTHVQPQVVAHPIAFAQPIAIIPQVERRIEDVVL